MAKFAWQDPNHYGIPTVIAVALHGIIIISLWAGWWTGWASETPIKPEPIPKNITATVIQTENAAVKKREQERLKKLEQQRLKQARLKAAKEKAAKEKAAKEKAAKEKAAKEKAAKEKAAKEKAAKEKAAKEKAAKEKAAKEKAAKEKAAKEKAAKEQAAKEQAAEAEAARRKEQQRQQKLQQQQIRAQESARAMDLIRQQVGEYWQFPPNVRGDEEVTLQVVCVPTGQVISVTVVKSSGNTALDRSVEQAVYKASPLPVPEDIVLFEQNFRSFKIKFRPENAEW